ncbi:MAG: tyrosine phosphatase superfamily protein [Gammaproteobacteria bacterium]|jgi:protein-tyrosine phosphatase|nr:tyrosine phosphatase superfamily protein [Gammaproteobacteria bacterium]
MRKICLGFSILAVLSFPEVHAEDRYEREPVASLDHQHAHVASSKPIKLSSCQFTTPTNANPCYVIDLAFNAYRNPSMYQGNQTGLSNLPMSGSSEPDMNPETWKTIEEGAKGKKIYIADLRQESHGYLNGKPITLVGTGNAMNIKLGSNAAAVLKAENQWLASIKKYMAIKNGWIKTSQTTAQQEELSIQSVTSEAQVAQTQGLHYVRIPMVDRTGLITPQNIEQIVALIRQANREGAWIHWHCREGHGRTSEVMVMQDIYYNAKNVSFEDIIARETSVPPNYNFSKYPNTYLVLQKFYNDVKAGKYDK